MNVFNDKKILVTGGAGFIGSHLIDAIAKGSNEIIIFDNFSSGKIEKIKHHLENPNIKLIYGDLTKRHDIEKIIDDYDIIFHLAANSEVKIEDPNIHFEENIHGTFNLLELIRKGDIKNFVFTSTSTVYGEAKQIPTPEDYQQKEPISFYGASKLACEALISAYSYHYGIKSYIYRLANVVGARTDHSVVKDFILKLRQNPKELEILGDGTQDKSYIYIEDCIDAMLVGLNSAHRINIFNIGSEDRIKVSRIAEIVVEEMGLKDVIFRFTGGVNGRGWIGDVKVMQLSIDKIKSLGWKPKYNSEAAIRKTIKELLKTY